MYTLSHLGVLHRHVNYFNITLQMTCAVCVFSFSITFFKSLNVKSFFSQHFCSPRYFFISFDNSLEELSAFQTLCSNPEYRMRSLTSSMLYSRESLCRWRSVGRCCKNSSFVTENKIKKCSYQTWNKCMNLGDYVLRSKTKLLS